MLNNFGGLEKKHSEYKNSKIVILPIEFDKSVSWQDGASLGPKAIIEASQQVELYDIETNTEVYKKGIFTAPSIKSKTSKPMIARGYKKTLSYLEDKKFVVTLGGDHSITLGPLTAHKDFYKNISILHLDAHADRRDDYLGNKFSHASIMARTKEVVDNIVSVGIRSMDITEKNCLKDKNTFLAADIYQSQNNNWMTKIIKQLKHKNVYLSFDIDVFDSGIMPSTGTPEPGGLDWYHVTNLIREVCKIKQLVGMDLVELAPNKHNKAPNFLAAKLLFKILSYKFQ